MKANDIRRVALMATVVGFGGAEKVILSLIENINATLFEITPIIFTTPDQRNGEFLNYLDKIVNKYYLIFVNKHRFKYFNPLANIVDAYKLLGKLNVELLHTHGYRADIMGVFAAKMTRVPLISTCHGFITNDRNLKLYNMLDRTVLRSFNEVIAVSEGIKNDLVSNGIKESHIAVIQNAVDGSYNKSVFWLNRQEKRKQFKIGDKEFVIGYIGRLSKEKGIDSFLEAIAKLRQSKLPIKVLIIGEGPQRAGLEAFVQSKKMSDAVIFTGFQRDVQQLIPALDVFVLPSITEGTPMSLLEAMGSGIPSIASAVGGIPQIIASGVNGILVSPGKPEEISNALRMLYKDEALRGKISLAAQKTINTKYNIKEWIKKIETEYSKLINDFHNASIRSSTNGYH